MMCKGYMMKESLPCGFINLSMRRSRFDDVVKRRSCFLYSAPEISRKVSGERTRGSRIGINVTEENKRKGKKGKGKK